VNVLHDVSIHALTSEHKLIYYPCVQCVFAARLDSLISFGQRLEERRFVVRVSLDGINCFLRTNPS
jgi:hypothetical protein